MCAEEAGLVPPCNPVKHLDNGGTAGLAFLRCGALSSGGEDDVHSIQMGNLKNEKD